MSFLGQEEELRELQDRTRYVFTAVVIGLGLVLSRLVYLQILNGDKMRAFSEENRIKRVRIAAPRGMIFDRTRTLLIDNRPSFDLEITPQYIGTGAQRTATLERIASIIKVPADTINETLKKARKSQATFMPVKIKTDLSRDEVAQLETWKITMPGVAVEMEIQRTNIYGDIAAHLLGYIGRVTTREVNKEAKRGYHYEQDDSIGKAGIEKELEQTVRGADGQELVEVDANGRRIRDDRRQSVVDQKQFKPESPGKNLILTVDQDLQNTASEAFGDRAGSLVAIDPRNGEILAMISRPAFNPTEFSRGVSGETWQALLKNEQRPLRDKTIQDHYSPGSVFKVITAVAGLENGIINENTQINCPGSIRVGNRVFRCNKQGGHGNVNVTQALTMSCNVFFQRVAQKLKGLSDITDWAFHLGLGKKTGVQLDREVPGLIPTEDWKMRRFNQIWTPGETVSVAIGQSFVLTTVIQLANLYAAISNGGTLYKPYFIKAIESYDGKVLESFQPEVVGRAQQISQKTLDAVKKGLLGVINNPKGTGFWQRIPGIGFAGKTGTSQVIRLNNERIFTRCESMKYNFRHHAVFAGFAPAEDPVIAVAVLTEHGCHGASGAAPVARAVIIKYLQKYFPDTYGKIIEESKNKPEFRLTRQATPAVESEDVSIEETVPIEEAQPAAAPEEAE